MAADDTAGTAAANGDVDVTREDPRITDVLVRLDAVELEVVRDKILTGDVYIDGRQFIDCTFVDARLITSTGRFDLGKLAFEGTYSYETSGALTWAIAIGNLIRDASRIEPERPTAWDGPTN